MRYKRNTGRPCQLQQNYSQVFGKFDDDSEDDDDEEDNDEDVN